MTDDTKKGIPDKTWNAISIGAFMLSIALGIVIYAVTDDIGNALWTLLIVFGIYVAAASPFRDKETENFGPTSADAATAGGLILAGIGASGMVYSLTHEVLYTVAVIIVVVAIIGMFMAIKNRNV